MPDTISHLPAAAEQPRGPESAWTADNERWLAELGAAAEKVNCGICPALPGDPCQAPGNPGTHLQRFARARRRGLFSAADFSRLLTFIDEPVFRGTTVIRRGGAR